MNKTAEVVVIGGGIIGCAISYYLAKRGVSVICLEGADHFGNGGSSRNGGGVRQSGSDSREIPLVISGRHFPRNLRLTVSTIRMETYVSEKPKSTNRS